MQCFIVCTHSRSLVDCENSVGDVVDYFHKVWVMDTIRTSPFSTEVLLKRVRQNMGHERLVDQLELGT